MARSFSTNSATIINRTPAITAFLASARKFQPMREEEILAKLAEGTDEAKNAIVDSYALFMFSFASKFAQGDTILELVSYATIGMKKAMKSFDSTMGVKFITYAVHYMYMEISEYFRTVNPVIYRSCDAKLNGKVTRINDKFFATNGRYPTESEVVDSLKEEYGIEAKESEVSIIRVSSMDSQVSTDEDSATAGEIGEIATATASINDYEKDIEQEQKEREVNLLLSVLTPMERNVITMLYGLNGEVEHEKEDIAERYGLTAERVRQISKEALRKLTASKERVLARA